MIVALQQAIYNHLSAGLEASVYDDVPYQPEGLPNADFPFVVIGDVTAAPFDTDDSVGFESTVTIHSWSNYSGMKEVKEMMESIYNLFHRYKFTITGYDVLDSLFEFSQVFLENDGRIRHGVQRFRITFMEE